MKIGPRNRMWKFKEFNSYINLDNVDFVILTKAPGKKSGGIAGKSNVTVWFSGGNSATSSYMTWLKANYLANFITRLIEDQPTAHELYSQKITRDADNATLV